MMKLVVDGYNLLFHLGLSSPGDLEEARDALLDMLAEYGKMKKRSILVVFDGQKGAPGGAPAKKWVRTIFTTPPESADDRIVKLAQTMREQAMVVSGDTGLIQRIISFNCPHADIYDFIGKMEQARYFSVKGLEEGAPQEKAKKPKKGSARKLPKKKRRKKRYLDKL